MLKLSRKVEYGLISIMHLAKHGEQPLVTTRELADHYHMPTEILGKVLQKLVKDGLLDSIQGSMGGYRLRRSIGDIKLGHVIEALEGPIHMVRCNHDPGCCDQYPSCNIREPALKIQQQLLDFVHSIPLTNFEGSIEDINEVLASAEAMDE